MSIRGMGCHDHPIQRLMCETYDNKKHEVNNNTIQFRKKN